MDRYRSLFNDALDMIHIVDQKGRIIDANPIEIKTLGYTRDEFIGKYLPEIFHPDYKNITLKNLREVLEKGKEVRFLETAFITKQGEKINVEVNAIPLKEKGKISGGRAIVRNISTRKQADNAIRREKDIAQRYLDIARDIIVFIDVNEEVSLINQSGIHILGYKQKEIIGKNWFDNFIPMSIRDKVKTDFHRLIARDIGSLEYYENPILNKEGEERIIAWHNKILEDDEGNIAGTLSSGDDITERIQTKEALENSEKRYRTLIENVDEAILVAQEGRFIFANPKAEELLGRPLSELSERPLLEFIYEEDRELVRDHYERRLKGEASPNIYTFRILDKSGQIRWVEIKVVLISWEEKQATLSLLTDITKQKQAQELLKESEDRYKTLIEMSPAAILVIQEGKITYCCPVTAKILGATHPLELIDKPLLDFVHPDSHEAVKKRLELIEKEKNTSPNMEHKFVGFDGRIIDVEVKDTYIQYYGKPAVLSVLSDVTEHKKSERYRKENEERFRNLVEGSLQGILIHRDHKPLFVNEAWASIHGYTTEEILEIESVVPLMSSKDQAHMVEYKKARLRGESVPTNYEYQGVKKDGPLVWLENRVMLIEWDGKPAIQSIIVDISERKRAEKMLLENEERYRKLFNYTGVALRVFDAETFRIEDVNQASIDLHGYSREEFLTLKITDLSVDPDEAKIGIQKTREHGGTYIPFRYFKKKDGSIFPGEIYSGTFHFSGRKKIIGAVHDLTERIKADEARIRMEAAIEQAAESVMITDPEATIQYVNPAFEQVTGFSSHDIIGENPRLLKSGKQDASFYESLWNTLLSGKPWTGQFINKKRDGTLFNEEASISPVLDTNGTIMNYVAVKRDITEELKIEEQLRRSQRMEAIGTLAGGIAHDFNNILSAVIGYGELGMDKVAEGSDLKNKLQEIVKAGYRAKDLIKQILSFSHQAEQKIISVSVKHIAKEVLKMLRASISTTVEIRDAIRSDKQVLGDPSQIHQVIMNLCTNSAHAMKESGGILELSLDDCEIISESEMKRLDLLPGQYLKLGVRDTGCGIPRDIVDQIFNPFFTTKDKGEGTGMGLSVVHGIVGSMGGAITVESEPEKGTSFEVYLPAIQTETEAEEKVQTILTTGTEHILIVDDEKTIVDIVKQILDIQGYQVTTRTSSIEALELFKVRSQEFDLIIMDLNMPNMSGLALSKEVKRIRPDIPIILCTGFSDNITETKLKEHGISSIILKPISRQEIVQKVRQILDEQSD